MAKSRFCFVPRGVSGWTSRLFRALFAGCVPVVLSDDYEIPFLSLFKQEMDWFIRWPMRQVDEALVQYLKNFDINLWMRMRQNGMKVRCWFLYFPTAIDAEAAFEGGENFCPEWRTKNAYMATHALLYQKKYVSKMHPHTFVVPTPDNIFLVNSTFHTVWAS